MMMMMMMMMTIIIVVMKKLEGKIAVVTGGSEGIGFASANASSSRAQRS